jgi:hypothetical protein
MPPRRLAALLLVLLLAPGPAHATRERFDAFDLVRQEEDDENALDVLLARPPAAWREAWERAPGGFRSSQGCLTAGQWYLVHELRARSPLGDTAHLEIGIEQVQDHETTYEWLQLDGRFPTRFGLWGVRFRPSFDKSRQDFAVLWDLGGPGAAHQLQFAFTFEDLFNSFWEFRQSRVGDRSEPYERHPLEPSLRHVWRGPRHRLETRALWLTPSRQRFDDPDPAARAVRTLWSTDAGSQLELQRGDWHGELALALRQAASDERRDAVAGDARSFRARWSAELAVRRALRPGLHAEARWLHQERLQTWRPPLGEGRFHAVDRVPVVELGWQARPSVHLRFGAMRGRIGVSREGLVPAFSYGTRTESRVFVGLRARFGRVEVQGVEGIELDREPYEVSMHHDKGFVQIQTTF